VLDEGPARGTLDSPRASLDKSRDSPPVGAVAGAGLGLRTPHVSQVLAERPAVPWFEVHSENYFGDGGSALTTLERIRADYPIALHGVGLSLGSVDALDMRHVARLKSLAARIEPVFVSEHLCWGALGGRHYNELLPLPYTAEALEHVCARVDAVQEHLGREILIENVSTYYVFPESTIPEHEFIAAVAARTGCRILLDVNNIHVNATNHGGDALAFVDAMVPESVGEIHLAGFHDGGDCLIDTHGTRVSPEVWSLYQAAVERLGAVPTLVEWDTDIPAFAVLQDEASIAQSILNGRR
jgi:uncharacterized protein (UPF0276 family)